MAVAGDGYNDALFVQTGTGKVCGIVAHDVRTWRGIPFAAPSIGVTSVNVV